jgi:UDP-N-acetylmuramate dehydrogenase
MDIQEHIPLRPKTTLRIGGEARYYAELKTKEDAEEAVRFTEEKHLPLIVLGGGSNTIFADGTIDALVVKIAADNVDIDGTTIRTQSGKYLANLINELAEKNLDLSPLTGIPGTIGGAVYGNSGQGYGGTWTDSFITNVEVYIDSKWKTFTNDQCGFGYRTSVFRPSCHAEPGRSTIIWETTLRVPSCPKDDVQAEIDRLLQRRLETQPHVKTAGSCFLSLSKDTPAWKLIDAAGLRGQKVGGITVSKQHANFLINEDHATFEDAKMMVEKIRSKVKTQSNAPLQVEMRFVEQDGNLTY